VADHRGVFSGGPDRAHPPPLVAEHGHIDELVEKAWRCLDLTARSLADCN
jgi:hypothetical protein